MAVILQSTAAKFDQVVGEMGEDMRPAPIGAGSSTIAQLIAWTVQTRGARMSACSVHARVTPYVSPPLKRDSGK
jgi:hypothetical protein